MVMRWSDPFAEVFSLRDAMNRLLNEAFVRPTTLLPSGGSTLPLAVLEHGDHYYVKALVPGVKPENVEITVQDRTITIKGAIPGAFSEEEMKQGNMLVDEIGSYQFTRSFTLPKEITGDRIEASYDYGVLTLTVPIAEHAQPKRIAIKSQPQLVEASLSR